jgi:hypothetical protein
MRKPTTVETSTPSRPYLFNPATAMTASTRPKGIQPRFTIAIRIAVRCDDPALIDTSLHDRRCDAQLVVLRK